MFFVNSFVPKIKNRLAAFPPSVRLLLPTSLRCVPLAVAHRGLSRNASYPPNSKLNTKNSKLLLIPSCTNGTFCTNCTQTQKTQRIYFFSSPCIFTPLRRSALSKRSASNGSRLQPEMLSIFQCQPPTENLTLTTQNYHTFPPERDSPYI